MNRFCWGAGDLEHHLKEDFGNIKKNPIENFEIKNKHDPSDFDQFKKHGESLSEETVGHITNYKVDSNKLNTKLREDKHLPVNHSKKSSASKPMVEHLDHATNHKLTKPLIVYRGSQGKDNAGDAAFQNVGHEFTDHGYTSTTTSHRIAHSFSNRFPSKHEHSDHIFAIHLKPGDKAHHVDMHPVPDDDIDENEILLHRGTRFRVIGHTSHDDGRNSKIHVTHLRVVSQNPREIK